MRIYIASYFNTRARLFPWRLKIEEMGHSVVSTWFDEEIEVAEIKYDSNLQSEEHQAAMARKDLNELADADLIILDTFDKNPRGGREVEFGFMLGHPNVPYTWRVGPARNIFHHLADRTFKHWGEVIDALHKARL